jgi:hypothetical protein
LWKDTEAAQIFQQLPHLSSIDLKACPLLGQHAFQALLTTNHPTPRSVPLVELALEDFTLDAETWQTILTNTSSSSCTQSASSCLTHLERLKLSRCTGGGLTDDVIIHLLAQTTKLQALDVSYNYDFTDTVLDAIRMYTSPSLRNLNLSGLVQLSAEALEAFFTPVDNDGTIPIATPPPPPPRLKVLELADLDQDAVTDNVLHAALMAAATTAATHLGTTTSAGSGGGSGLIRLNVQGARQLTDTSLEYVVKYSPSTIEDINVSYCTGLTDQGMGYLMDQCGIQLRHVELYGLAQLTDTFLEGHQRSTDPTLVLTGIWMKKSSSRTIQ